MNLSPQQQVALSKQMEAKHGREVWTEAYNLWRAGMNMRPVKDKTITRFSSGKSGYENGLYIPYSTFLNSWVATRRSRSVKR